MKGDNKEPAPTIKPETAKPRISIPPTTIQQPNGKVLFDVCVLRTMFVFGLPECLLFF